jgi:Exopolysaccharide biosynthesis protein YbjH
MINRARASKLALLFGVALLGCAATQAQEAVRRTVEQSERLSDWLLRQKNPVPYPIGLSWLVPQEVAAQEKLKQGLLTSLIESERSASLAMQPDLTRLKAWLMAQAATGRAVLPSADARWLQAHPSQDPILAPGQRLSVPDRPLTVTVLQANGELCRPQHVSGALAKSYVAVCNATRLLKRGAKAWIAQPDGRTSQAGISPWTADEQDEPAPGSWIWAPSDDERVFPEVFSKQLIQFLATLGVAPEVNPVRAETPQYLTERAAPAPAWEQRSFPVSSSDWGEIGLIQTPTARMERAGTLRVQFSRVQPYTRNNIMFQPFEGFETGFRYTNVSNRKYDALGELDTDQTFVDKSIDFKWAFLKERQWLPAMALGVRDMAGTGIFSSEYLVANKRFGDWDASLGLGFGNMGSRAELSNPLGRLNNDFNVRPSTQTDQGGQVGAKAFFRGPAALFGGVQWRASPTWVLKLERDGNNYQNEGLNNPLPFHSPWNFGAVYRHSPGVDVSMGFERGNTFMLGVSFSIAVNELQIPKLLHPTAPRFVPTPVNSTENNSPPNLTPSAPESWDDLIEQVYTQTSWQVAAIEDSGELWKLRLSAGPNGGLYSHRAERLPRLNALLQAKLPARVKRWQIEWTEHGMSVTGIEVDRANWVNLQTQWQPPSLQPKAIFPYAPSKGVSPQKGWHRPERGLLPLNFGPSYSQILGGPDAFLLYKLGAQLSSGYQFSPGVWMDGAIDTTIADNMSGFKYTAPSNLPRVRTYQREFETSNRTTMPILQLTSMKAINEQQFVSVYAGYLEKMFAGVGAEWLYRPWRSPVAFGVDVNHVQQREFKQNFDLRDYKVLTGHATLYWDTGLSDLLVKVQAGQYLAGDRGVTLDVSRQFKNGTSMGFYVTKTNVSAEQFGEGSFDKGIYLNLPFDVLLPKYSDSTAAIVWQPLSRDGGARLQRQHPLYNSTSGRDPRAFDLGATLR